MRKNSQNIEDKLLDYLDGQLTTAEYESVTIMISEHPELQQRLEELRQANNLMKQLNKIESPSSNFTASVMAGLNRKVILSGLPIKNSLLLLGGVLLVAFMAAVLISVGVFDNTTTTLDLNSYSLPKNIIDKPLPSIPVDGKMVVNVIVILNLIVGFVVLDRAVLKPFFRRRMTAGH